MSLKLWKGVAGSALLLGLASPLLMNCNGLPGIPGASCDELKTGDFANFKLEGNAEATAKFKGFLESVFTLDKLAAEMEVGLIASCGELGTAIGMGPAEVKADPAGGEGAKKVCEAVAAKVGGMIKANAEAKLSVEIGEPKCYADIEALTKCFGECGAAISPGEFKAACEGGELAGTCEGDCSGSCSAEAGVQCKGTCSGTCEGKCDGKDSKGNCAGKCDGKCSAGCKLEGGAKCEGTCSGGCSVEIKAPKCTGEFKPPSVSADCQMSCAAKTAASVSCDPPTVKIKVDGKAGGDIEKLVAGLQIALPKIVKIQLGMGKRLVTTAEGLVKGVAELPKVAASLAGMAAIKAASCATMAVEMAGGASGSISINVKASASVGGSVGG
jgi:hypothetical protein